MTDKITAQQWPDYVNEAAPETSFYTPAQHPPSGTASNPQPDGSKPPKIFQPLKIRGLTLQNRILCSPMCQYSSPDGQLTPWHMAHLGGIISRGPGLTFVEATAVTKEGRITPEDSGLWKDDQIGPLQDIVEFAHSQNQKIGIQLAHAGRKASTVAPWMSRTHMATKAANGWPEDVHGPSDIAYSDSFPIPKALSLSEIDVLKDSWVAAVQRALKAGFDVIEIHSAHGYLFHSFLSPVSNTRTDHYGGTFENRTRLLLEVVELVRSTIPDDMPLFVRLSGTDWLERVEGIAESWEVQQSARLAVLLAERGVDLLDVSSAANHPKQQVKLGPAYQAHLAQTIKEKVGNSLLVGTVGMVSSGALASEILEGGLDVVFVARGFQKNPGLVWAWAEELGVEISVAKQIRWGFGGKVGWKEKPKS